MRYEQVHAILLQQWTYTGGGPSEPKASEFRPTTSCWSFLSPTSGSAVKPRNRLGVNAIPRSWSSGRRRSEAPAVWIAEGTLSYDGTNTLHYIKIIQFRGDKIARETIYFAEPFAAPEWRRPWVADGPRPRRHNDLPERIVSGG